MTDRELLECAAKAAGINRYYYEYLSEWGMIEDDPESGWWNPLTDDGDALRLAVKLGMCVTHFRVGKAGRNETVLVDDAVNFDPSAATRRAIVRVAAEIGKGMK